MAISTVGVFLMKKKSAETEYTKLVDIVDFGDLGGEPNQIDTSTLSDQTDTSILGRKQLGTIAFTSNFDWEEYLDLKADEYTDMDMAVWFGGEPDPSDPTGKLIPTGDQGKLKFRGMYTIGVNGGGGNEPVRCTITVAASTAIVPDET